jgi:hypothetical protein
MRKRSAIIAALILAMAWGAGMGLAANEPSPGDLKKVMGDNFQRVALILNNLISARYNSIPHDAELIVEHATFLMKSPPREIKTPEERSMFLTYATSLKTSASNLLVVTTELANRDKQRNTPGQLSVDYLRVAAASHYGIMVTNCVLCHNQFRRRQL